MTIEDRIIENTKAMLALTEVIKDLVNELYVKNDTPQSVIEDLKKVVEFEPIEELKLVEDHKKDVAELATWDNNDYATVQEIARKMCVEKAQLSRDNCGKVLAKHNALGKGKLATLDLQQTRDLLDELQHVTA